MFISVQRALKLVLLALSGALLVPATAWAQAVPAPIKLALVEGLSGPAGNAGEAVYRNVLWAVERVNARGGVKASATGGHRPLLLERFDSKGQTDEALSALRSAIDGGARFVLQGNSSATAAALIDAINKHNEREPAKRVILLNYAAVEPALTNEKCSFWHFRFDAHADMRMSALMSVLKDDKAVQKVYLIGQDYSFGQSVLREARRQLGLVRPDVQVVAEELHPMARVKDFLPYANKIKASGAQAVVTGNWGNDLTLLVKAAKDVGFDGKFYTFYGNALGAPSAMGDTGIGKVIAVADWMPNVQSAASESAYRAFRARFPKPEDDYMHMRMQLMVDALAQAIEHASAGGGTGDAGAMNMVAIGAHLERAKVTFGGQSAEMRASDHQFQQALVVGLMERQGTPGVPFDVEGSGYGFRIIRTLTAAEAQQPSTCAMRRPG